MPGYHHMIYSSQVATPDNMELMYQLTRWLAENRY